MDRVRTLLHADEIHCRGITGKQVTVAILDSGCSLHPDYADRILAFRDMVNDDVYPGVEDAYDDASHGTHVTGIIGGNGSSLGGRFCGIAPGCSLIHVKVLDSRGEGDMADIIRAIDWVITNRRHYSIRILNISAGTTKGEQDEGAELLVRKVEEAWDAGLVVVVAAGNMGPRPMTVTVPGNSRKVITVGSVDGFRRMRGGFAPNYSGCGPTRTCICKPELVAPGTDIVSCSPQWRHGRYYGRKSGTSMAAPTVSGCAALLLEREPQLSNVQVKMRLREAAVDMGLPHNRQGWGMPDLRKLIL